MQRRRYGTSRFIYFQITGTKVVILSLAEIGEVSALTKCLTGF